MRRYPALELTWSGPIDRDGLDLVLADLDDFGPTALDETPDGVRLFFLAAAARDAALARVSDHHAGVQGRALDVPDEAWAERSQAALQPVGVDGLVVTPPWGDVGRFTGVPVIVQPSMGFGTGHHASTRLCLRLLQTIPIAGRSVLDVGTGSGVLAIAAVKLGAARAVAIDVDPDATQSALENLQLNDVSSKVDLRLGALPGALEASDPRFDVVLANLTGSVLARLAPDLVGAAAASGAIIASGILAAEAAEVGDAFAAAGWHVADQRREQEWVGFLFTQPGA